MRARTRILRLLGKPVVPSLHQGREGQTLRLFVVLDDERATHDAQFRHAEAREVGRVGERDDRLALARLLQHVGRRSQHAAREELDRDAAFASLHDPVSYFNRDLVRLDRRLVHMGKAQLDLLGQGGTGDERQGCKDRGPGQKVPT